MYDMRSSSEKFRQHAHATYVHICSVNILFEFYYNSLSGLVFGVEKLK